MHTFFVSCDRDVLLNENPADLTSLCCRSWASHACW